MRISAYDAPADLARSIANAASSASRSGSNAAASTPAFADSQPPAPSAVQAAAPALQRPRNARRDSIAAASFAQEISRIVPVVASHTITTRPGVQRGCLIGQASGMDGDAARLDCLPRPARA